MSTRDDTGHLDFPRLFDTTVVGVFSVALEHLVSCTTCVCSCVTGSECLCKKFYVYIYVLGFHVYPNIDSPFACFHRVLVVDDD